MKLIIPLFGAVLLCIFAIDAEGAGEARYSVRISGVVKTQLTGTDSSLSTIPFNNATILKAIVATGTSGVTKAGDLDIIITPGDLEVDVIVKATHDYITTILVQNGQSTNVASVDGVSRNSVSALLSANNYTFNLPNAASPYNVNISLNTKYDMTTNLYSRIVMTFNGGNAPTTPGIFIEGSVRKSETVYHFGG